MVAAGKLRHPNAEKWFRWDEGVELQQLVNAAFDGEDTRKDVEAIVATPPPVFESIECLCGRNVHTTQRSSFLAVNVAAKKRRPGSNCSPGSAMSSPTTEDPLGSSPERGSGKRYRSETEAEQVRRRAGSTSVAASCCGWRDFAVLPGGLRHWACPNLLHAAIVGVNVT